MRTPDKIAAYQLSLLGDDPQPGKAWTPTFHGWTIMGVRVPPDGDALRQIKMLSSATKPGAYWA